MIYSGPSPPAHRDLTKFRVWDDAQDSRHDFICSHTSALQSQMPHVLSVPGWAGAPTGWQKNLLLPSHSSRTTGWNPIRDEGSPHGGQNR